MFSWNWKWRCKCQHVKNGYLMRFLNKAKLVDLFKFDDLNLLGTEDVIIVQSWYFDSQAIQGSTPFGLFPNVLDIFFLAYFSLNLLCMLVALLNRL